MAGPRQGLGLVAIRGLGSWRWPAIGLGLAVAGMLHTASMAEAQYFDKRIGGIISDEAADSAIGFALRNIQKAQCTPEQSCARATAEELASPPIATADARTAMIFAVKSAMASWCALDYRRSFLAMMARVREEQGFGERQAALMALVHGAFMQHQLSSYEDSGKPCPEQLKARLDALLPKLSP